MCRKEPVMPMVKSACLILVFILASACGGGAPGVSTATTPSPVTASSVSVTCQTTTLTTVGQQTFCSAVAVLSNGTTQDQTLASQWNSSNASLASVNAT